MDAEKRLWKYSGPSKAGLVIGILFLAAALLCTAMLVVNMVKPVGEPALFTSLKDTEDSYCTLKIVGVSDAVLKRDSDRWYFAEGEDGYYYLVQLKSSQVKDMSAQRAYWDETGGKPAPVTVNGLARSITDEMFKVLVEGENMTVSEMRDILGRSYLDATARPGSDDNELWYTGLLFSGLFGLILTLMTAGRRKIMRRNLDALGGTYAVEQAAIELDAPTTEQIGRDRLRMGPSHMFGRKNGLVLAYDDVVWVYQQVVRTYFVITGRNLMVADVRGKVTPVFSTGRGGEDELRALADKIALRNPNVLLGFNKENRAAWQEAVKARKAQ